MTPRRFVVTLILVGTVARLIMAGATGLGIDESYAVSVARRLSLSYFDHPPLHFWLVGGWARLWGAEDPILVRLPLILLFAGTTWYLFRLTARIAGERAGAWAAAAASFTPVFVTSSLWVLPDGPLLFFTVAAADLVASIVLAPVDPRRPLLRWLGAGTLAGLALLSKYHGVFLLGGVFLFLLTAPLARRFLRTPGPWLGAALALLLFVPVIVWNAEHDWASFAFQLGRGSGAGSWTGLGRMLAGELLYLGPVVVPFLVVALVRALAAGPGGEGGWFLAMLAIGPIAVFNLDAAIAAPLPHWTAPGWLFVFPLLGGEIVRWEKRHGRLIRGVAAANALLIALTAVTVFSQARLGWLARAGIDPGPRDPTLDLLDYSPAIAELRRRGDLPDGTVVAATAWLWTGKVAYAAGPRADILCLCGEPHHFGFMAGDAAYAGRDVLVLVPFPRQGEIPSAAASFSTFERLPPVAVTRGGVPALDIGVFRGTGLRR